jgi:hypothetical protein
MDRTQIRVIGREIPHACIWTADGIASCYATIQTAISISVPSQNAPLDTPPSNVAFDVVGRTFRSYAVRRTDMWKLLLAAKWSASRRRNGYFGVPTTATDYSPTWDSHIGIYVQFSSNTRLCGMRHDRHEPWYPLAKLSNCIGRLQKNIWCEASGYRWWGIASLRLQMHPVQEKFRIT